MEFTYKTQRPGRTLVASNVSSVETVDTRLLNVEIVQPIVETVACSVSSVETAQAIDTVGEGGGGLYFPHTLVFYKPFFKYGN